MNRPRVLESCISFAKASKRPSSRISQGDGWILMMSESCNFLFIQTIRGDFPPPIAFLKFSSTTSSQYGNRSVVMVFPHFELSK